MSFFTVSTCVLIWAGVSLGGSLIAAPAKFRAREVSRDDLLRVGRAQFLWMGFTEAFLLLLTVLAVLTNPIEVWWILAVAIALFAIQRVGIMPALDAHTRARIAGESVGNAPLHQAYVVLELLKFSALLGTAALNL